MSIVNRIKQFYEDVKQKRRSVQGSDLSFDSSSIPGKFYCVLVKEYSVDHYLLAGIVMY